MCIARPEMVAFLQGRRVLMVACGSEHSIAIVEKMGAKFKVKDCDAVEIVVSFSKCIAQYKICSYMMVILCILIPW